MEGHLFIVIPDESLGYSGCVNISRLRPHGFFVCLCTLYTHRFLHTDIKYSLEQGLNPNPFLSLYNSIYGHKVANFIFFIALYTIEFLTNFFFHIDYNDVTMN